MRNYILPVRWTWGCLTQIPFRERLAAPGTECAASKQLHLSDLLVSASAPEYHLAQGHAHPRGVYA